MNSEHWGNPKVWRARYSELERENAYLRRQVANLDKENLRLREDLAAQEIRNRKLIGLKCD